MNPVIVITDRDNVATALETLPPGQVLAGPLAVTVRETIPRGHKVAIRAIPAGENVIKYGSSIGVATMAIPAGTHVHTHNVASARGRGDRSKVEQPADAPRLAEPPDDRGAA